MARRRLPPAAILGMLLVAGACATTTDAGPSRREHLEAAEAHVKAEQWDAALAELDVLADELCPPRLRDRRDLAIARAEFGRGEPWDAFLALERFSDNYPHSELRGDAVDLLWRIGKGLTDSDGGFLFFWSDERAGRAVLEHLVTRHPDTRRFADAMQILGDMAFADGDYELAQSRYSDILFYRPESDWRFYAQFRFAMSIVASLEGPDYDLARMELAARELRTFLRNHPEDPRMVAETEEALTLLLEWQATRHLQIADYYRTVGSAEGERYHLDLATSEDFAGTSVYAAAVERRAGLETATNGGRP